jgi:NAD(P)-dependent dehydrogenase (short-subunit alcohol dehydrogenase family)
MSFVVGDESGRLNVTELDGRVVVVTGAGRGLGREHALLMAAEGASVVVNDLGGSSEGAGSDLTPAMETVEEIRAAGGTAIVNGDDVADWHGAKRLIEAAVAEFGDLHVLVNNAGILRDRMIANMSEEEFDSVVRVHLRGHFCPTRHAAEYWRSRAKAGVTADRSLVNTSSTSGLLGNVGQGNYGPAKAGIASMTIIADIELSRYGVRANAIAPAARTRLTASVASTPDPDAFDPGDPANVSPMVAYLATADASNSCNRGRCTTRSAPTSAGRSPSCVQRPRTSPPPPSPRSRR